MKKLLIGTALASILFASAANATISISLGSGTNTKTFDNNPLGATSGSSNWEGPITWSTSTSSGYVANDFVSGVHRPPLGDTSHYLFATSYDPASTATITWATSRNSFDILWGSPDSYNTLTLSNGDSYTGVQLKAFFGFTTEGDNANTRWVHVYDDKAFNGFTASSTGIAFEFDGSAVPEPATWALMLSGFAAMGFAGYRSRKNASAAA